MLDEHTRDNVLEQSIAAYVDYLNSIRLSDLLHSLDVILVNETNKLSDLATRTANALSNLDLAKLEIENLISNNRGGDTGVHGFIAEFAETGIRNARDVFEGLQKSIILLNDNGAADILLQGNEVQMKFYSNILEEIKQASRYENMIMMFPKDHVEVIEKIMSGAKTVEYNGNRLSLSQINNIKQAIENESNLRGSQYSEWLRPSLLRYRDVQKGIINQTLSGEVDAINKQAFQQELDIKNKANKEKSVAYQKSQPTFAEASKVAGVGAAVQGGLNLAIFIYKKHKDGKDIWDFDATDWQQCGISTAKGAIKGGVSGFAIYGLTNVYHLAAPSAGAIVSGTFGLSTAIVKYRNGDINTDDFINLVTLNSLDATGAAIGAAIGQSLIPIPVIGALIGSIVATTSLSLGKDMLNKHERSVILSYQKNVNDYINRLDVKFQKQLDELMSMYHELGELQEYAFDYNLNLSLRFISSIDMAKKVGVPETRILKSIDEIDDYFLS